ncbi:hypothetical protein BD749_3088 [Pontibacter ramchanderi]|uniref:Uncharacterized protein n=1 Tax=Pontibacter ramchanderi TaxID=1179743 RepID=A0A2N3U909_9BACT|nr:hypothetical protein BD749_3088 [Pontibacter ramchanderi]
MFGIEAGSGAAIFFLNQFADAGSNHPYPSLSKEGSCLFISNFVMEIQFSFFDIISL